MDSLTSHQIGIIAAEQPCYSEVAEVCLTDDGDLVDVPNPCVAPSY